MGVWVGKPRLPYNLSCVNEATAVLVLTIVSPVARGTNLSLNPKLCRYNTCVVFCTTIQYLSTPIGTSTGFLPSTTKLCRILSLPIRLAGMLYVLLSALMPMDTSVS